MAELDHPVVQVALDILLEMGDQLFVLAIVTMVEQLLLGGLAVHERDDLLHLGLVPLVFHEEGGLVGVVVESLGDECLEVLEHKYIIWE